MIKRYKKVCICCGKEYEYCSSCAAFINKPAWMNIYHDENCKTLFTATSEYYAGNMSEEDFKKVVEKCNVSNREHFEDGVRNAINIVYSEPVKEEVKKEVVESDSKPVENKFTYQNKKKNYRKN